MSAHGPMIARRACRQLSQRSFALSRPCAAVSSQSWTSRGRRWESTQAAAAAAPINPKIATIVDQIGSLTLLETADLVSTLKQRLNIPDMPMGGFAAGPAAAAPAAAPAEEEEAAPAAQEKTLFTLKLTKIDTAQKPKIIKEIKSMLGLSLVDSKKFVESAPKLMKENVAKEEAEKIVATLKAVGGEVSME